MFVRIASLLLLCVGVQLAVTAAVKYAPCLCSGENKDVSCLGPTDLSKDIAEVDMGKCDPSSSGKKPGIMSINCLGRSTLAPVNQGFAQSFGNEISTFNMFNCNLTALGSSAFSSFPKLKTILISKTTMPALLPSVFNLVSRTLEWLSIEDGNLETIPSLMFKQTRLRRLYIIRNKITNIPADSFSTLPTLEQVALTDNNISTLDMDTFNDNINLMRVTLHGNGLTEINFHLFKQQKNLTYLNAARNLITTLKNENPTLKLASLRELILTGNKISTLPDGIFLAFPSLYMLLMGENDITRIPPMSFVNHHELKIVDFAWNKIQILEGNLFKNCPKLSLIRLQHNYIHTINSDAFMTWGAQIGAQISIRNNSVTDPSNLFQSISGHTERLSLMCEQNGIQNLPKLPSTVKFNNLFFSGNQLTNIEAQTFTNVSIEGSLQIKYNGHALQIEEAALKDLSPRELVLSNSTLTNLDFLESFSGHDLVMDNIMLGAPFKLPSSGLKMLQTLQAQNAGIETLPSGLPELTRLVIASNAIGRITKLPPKLTELNLSSNRFPIEIDDDALANSKLEMLYLDMNTFSKLPDFSLAKSLNRLHMSHCIIHDPSELSFGSKLFILKLENVGLTSVPAALKNATCVHDINLSGNAITVIRREDFINNLKTQYIYMSNNRIKTVDDCAFSYLKHLRILDLSNNMLTTWQPHTLRPVLGLGYRFTLKLDNNYFATLEQETWRSIFSYYVHDTFGTVHAYETSMKNNPLNCTCAMLWVIQHNVHVKLMGYQYSDLDLQGTCTINGAVMDFGKILPSDFDCDGAQDAINLQVVPGAEQKETWGICPSPAQDKVCLPPTPPRTMRPPVVGRCCGIKTVSLTLLFFTILSAMALHS